MSESRVCFVVSDLLGMVANSGIATATSYGALVLARAGHDVTLVHTRQASPLDEIWEKRFADAGVQVEVAPASVVAPEHMSASQLIFRHLRDRDFDTIVFQDWLALGWASMVARSQGLAFDGTHMVHICHGPDAWLQEANGQVQVDTESLALAEMGRVSAELSDTIVGPSRYLLDWMDRAGWKLPDRRYVVPLFTKGHVDAIEGLGPWDARVPRPPAAIRELAFFGRLETRKGVRLYTESLNRINPSLLEGIRLSFLGRTATYTCNEVRGMLSGPVRRAVEDIEFHTDYDNDAACAHLSRPGVVAIIASLVDNSPSTIYECIEGSISFLATAAGGTSELVAEKDRDRCLVAPEPGPMAAALARLLEGGETPAPADPNFDGRESLRLWEEVFRWKPTPRVTVKEKPLVTAVVTHHDRPGLIFTAMEAVDAQDYSNLEIVVVDDGSELPESHRALDELERRTWEHPVRVLRQPNRYLGAARNAGARSARGDLLTFVDDDDVPMANFVSSLVTAHQSTGADAVTCAMQSFVRLLGPPRVTDDRGTWVFLGDALHLAMVVNCLGGAPVLVRRSSLEAVGGYHEVHGAGYEDWHLYVRLLIAGFRLVSVPDPLYWYRVLPGSMRATMSDYHSAQIVLDEFRRVLPPGLRSLPQLAYGQNAILQNRRKALGEDFGMQRRVQWLLEEQLRRAALPAPTPADDSATAGRTIREVVTAGRSQVARAVDAARSRARRAG